MTNSNVRPLRAGLFFQLTRRHLLVFFRNKIRLFFTFMVPFIIFVIYIFFLRDLEMTTAHSILSEKEVEEGLANGFLTKDATLLKHIETLIDTMMLSGIIAICTVTVSLQTNTMIVSDRETGVNRDFASSPISRNLLIASYFLFNLIVTVLICFAFLLVCLVYLACMNEFCITFTDFCTIFFILIYSSVVSVLFTVFICSFVSRDSTMASITTIVSTAIGFLIGAFMPLSMLPVWVQNVCVFVPGTFSCSMLRFSFMATPINELSAYVSGLGLSDGGALMSQITDNFGFNVKFFGMTLEPWMQAIGQIIFIVVLLVANILAGKNLVKVLGGMGKKLKNKNKK